MDVQKEIEFWQSFKRQSDILQIAERPVYYWRLTGKQRSAWHENQSHIDRALDYHNWWSIHLRDSRIPGLKVVSIEGGMYIGHGLTVKEAYKAALHEVRYSYAHNRQKKDRKGNVIGGLIRHHWSFVDGKIQYTD